MVTWLTEPVLRSNTKTCQYQQQLHHSHCESLNRSWNKVALHLTFVVATVRCSETSVNIYQTTLCNIPEDSHFHTRCHENLNLTYIRMRFLLILQHTDVKISSVKPQFAFCLLWSWGGSVSIVSDYRPDDLGSIPARGKDSFFSLCVQTSSLGPPRYLSNVYLGSFSPGAKRDPGA
jgi:hypothetical protein